MQQVQQWTDPSYPNEERLLKKPYGNLRTEDYAIPFFGLRTVQKGQETSNMALVDSFGSPAWIHIGSLKIQYDPI